jgi:hypothetical protein
MDCFASLAMTTLCDELAAMGIALKDNKDGATTWEVKR